MHKLEVYYDGKVSLKLEIDGEPANLGNGLLQCTVACRDPEMVPDKMIINAMNYDYIKIIPLSA